MNKELSTVYLAQHGETDWSLSGRCAGTTDLPLTEYGENSARRLGERLSKLTFARVFTSLLERTRKTCELVGCGSVAELVIDFVEWNYGQYEGRWTAEIRAERSGWDLFRHGCPSGETPKQITARADRVIARVWTIPGDVLLFTCGQFTRVLADRWIGLGPISKSPSLTLNTASLCALGYEIDLGRPVIRSWNDNQSSLYRPKSTDAHHLAPRSRRSSPNRVERNV
jgi:broad specificity phosphatase PhoE